MFLSKDSNTASDWWEKVTRMCWFG